MDFLQSVGACENFLKRVRDINEMGCGSGVWEWCAEWCMGKVKERVRTRGEGGQEDSE